MLSIISVPSPYHSSYGYSRRDHLSSIAEAQAARDQYIRFLATREELRRRRVLQAQFERRRYEAQLLAELTRVRSELGSSPYDGDDRSFPIRPHQQRHGFSQTPSSVIPSRRSTVKPRRLGPYSAVVIDDASTESPDDSGSANFTEVWKQMVEGLVERAQSEQETNFPKTRVNARSHCYARPQSAYHQSPDYRSELQSANATNNAGSSSLRSSPGAEGMKEELEKRLHSDPDTSIQDTTQADTSSSRSSTQQPEPSSEDTDPKGKGKETSTSQATDSSSPTDIVASLNALHNVEATLRTLESQFAFPAQLDFDTSPPSPALSVHSTSSALSSALTYSSKNAPVRYYEHALSSLLTDLDGIESHGVEEVRSKRKEVVAKIESALEEVEREVQGRLDAQKKSEAAARSIQTETIESSALHTEGSSTHSHPSDHSPEEGNTASFDESLLVPSGASASLTSIGVEPITEGEPSIADASMADSTTEKEPATSGQTEASIDSPPPVRVPAEHSTQVQTPLDAIFKEDESSEEPTGYSSTDDETVLVDDASDGGWSELEAEL